MLLTLTLNRTYLLLMLIGDLPKIVTTIGYLGIFLVILLETGLFFGFFLPGDSLLFTVGLLASQQMFTIWIVVPVLMLIAFMGYQLGYWFGKYLAKWLLRRKESFWFKPSHLQTATRFYQQHGIKTLVLGRFLPIVRTFIPIMAGMIGLPWRRYLILNSVGAFCWVGILTLSGFLLGQLVPHAQNYLLLMLVGIILLSFLPSFWRRCR